VKNFLIFFFIEVRLASMMRAPSCCSLGAYAPQCALRFLKLRSANHIKMKSCRFPLGVFRTFPMGVAIGIVGIKLACMYNIEKIV